MTRLFVSDIDGCLSEPYRPYRLGVLAAIRALVDAGDPARVPETPPGFAICTGRAYGYTEAMTQLLGLRLPALFEAGAGLFDPVRARREWHPNVTPGLIREVDALKRWISPIAEKAGLGVDTEKRTQAGLFGPSKDEIDAVLPDVTAHVQQHHPGFFVSSTPISIDVVSRSASKRDGLTWLSDRLDVDVSEMAYIGDTEGDLGALGLVGRSFAPSNAYDSVRAAVQTVTGADVSDGVLEALTLCMEENRS